MLITSSRYDSYAADTMWNCTPAVIWSAVEIHLSVIACCLPVMRPVVHAFGGWWGHNFSSGKGVSVPSRSSVKLGYTHRSNEHNTDGESTYNLATMTESNSAPTAADLGRIYGQGEGSDTVIASTGKAKNTLGPSSSIRSTDRAILVQYEVNLSFSRQYS